MKGEGAKKKFKAFAYDKLEALDTIYACTYFDRKSLETH